MYKIYFDKRFITVSGHPDRLQSYSLFHKYNDQKGLKSVTEQFLADTSLKSLNIYSYEIDHLWKAFRECFHNREAAGGVVQDRRSRILFIRRLNRWDLPKGHIEGEETPVEAARREVEEECGITPGEIITSLSESYHIYRWGNEDFLKRTFWFLFDYEGPEHTTPQMEEGISEAVWAEKGQLSTYSSGSWCSVADIIQEVRLKSGAY